MRLEVPSVRAIMMVLCRDGLKLLRGGKKDEKKKKKFENFQEFFVLFLPLIPSTLKMAPNQTNVPLVVKKSRISLDTIPEDASMNIIRFIQEIAVVGGSLEFREKARR